LLWGAVQPSRAAARATPVTEAAVSSSASEEDTSDRDKTQTAVKTPAPQATLSAISAYEGKIVESIYLPNAAERDREHLLQLVAQKTGEPLERDQVRESIRALFATGRFADIQAEVAPSGDGVALSFATSPNFFVGAVTVEGAPARPNANQILNAAKFQLGDLYAHDKLSRALENIRQLMQEDGYYRGQVTAETTSNLATQQIDILFHVKAGSQAHVGEMKVTGSSTLSSLQLQQIAHMKPGDRVTSVRVTDSLQKLRKKFQKQSRALAQVSIAQQEYRAEANAVDFTYQIDPGPLVLISAEGYHISRGVMKKEVPVYEENAVDDDLLNEGRNNLLDYLQTRGHFDAKVDIQKQSDPSTMHVIYKIVPGALHKLVLVEINGNKEFLDTAKLRSYLQIEPASRFSHGRYSGAMLKTDVATLENLYKSNGFRQVKIESKVDDDYKGRENHLAVHLFIHEGPRTRVGEVHIVGNDLVTTKELPELSTQAGQPYSEEDLASDRVRIINYYLNNGFPNATLDIFTQGSSSEPNREDVTYTIQEGERFTIDHVMLGGTDHTREYVVDREVQVKAGQPLSQQGLLDTQTRLYNLGIFSEVDTAVQNPAGSDPLKNVLVQVEEAKRYTFTYAVGMEFQTGQPSPSAPAGETGVSPRVGFDVTRLNVGGRDQSITFQSHVGRLQQRGLISYNIPKLFDNDKLKLVFTALYDNSLDVATFTSQRLEGKIELRQQFGNSGSEPGTRPGPNSITYRFDFRRVKASDFASDFSAGELELFSLPARVGGPGFTFIHDRRDNPLASTKGDYFTLDALAAPEFFGTRSETTDPNNPSQLESLPTNFGRALAQHSTYYAFGRKNKPGHQFVFARSTTLGLQQPFKGTRVLPPGSCPLNAAGEPTCSGIATIPLPEQFFAGGGNSHRGFGLNQAGPRDPTSGFPIGGTAQFVNSIELRFPETSLPYLGEGFGFAIFHDMGNVFTAPHDMLKGLVRWHQPDPGLCLPSSTTATQCITQFDNTGYDYTSHAVGVGVRYKTPIGPLRFDFGYNLNPTRYFQDFTFPIPGTNPVQYTAPQLEQQRLRRLNVFFSIGQPF
jgi:outer membrane protein insertion porin family